MALNRYPAIKLREGGCSGETPATETLSCYYAPIKDMQASGFKPAETTSPACGSTGIRAN